MEERDFGQVPDPCFSPEPASQRDSGKKRKLLFFAAIFVSLFFAGSVLAYRILLSKAPDRPDAYDPVTLKPKPPEGFFSKIGHFVFAKDVSLAGERDDRINILLLGIGGEGHDGPYLSDTMMIASLKPSTGQVAMVSIPRDLQVNIRDHGLQKINHANAFGEVEKPTWGGALAAEVVESTFHIDIHYYIRVDFRAFANIVDAVGGIRVAVDRSFTDPLYPAPNFAYQTVSFTRGVQTMDGDTALAFARSRHGSNGEGSDFARSRRQQKALLAMKEKVLSASTLTNPLRIKSILDALSTHITTNMQFGEMMELVKLSRTLATDEILTMVLDTSEQGYLQPGSGPDGAFVLAPKSGNFDSINRAIKDIFETAAAKKNDTPAQDAVAVAAIRDESFPAARIEIQNGTWRAGLAVRMKKRLVDASFPVETIGNTTNRPREKSAIYLIRPASPAALADAIQRELHLPLDDTVPAAIIAASGTDILIVLGEDWNE